MAIIKVSGRGLRTAVGLFSLLSASLLFSACWLVTQPTPTSSSDSSSNTPSTNTPTTNTPSSNTTSSSTTTGPIYDIVALVGQTTGTTTAGVHVFYNDGKGNFTAGPVLKGVSEAPSGYTDLALGNLADHQAPSSGNPPVQDIFVTNNGKGPNQVWINQGAGTFKQQSETWGTQSSTAVALGQIFGVAGEVDAFVANGTNAPKVWQNGSKDASFTDYAQGEGQLDTDYNSPNNPQRPYDTIALAMGALSGTGGTSADVFTGNFGQQDRVYQDVSNYLGTYSNTTTDANTAGATSSTNADYTQGVAVGDLNGDGLPDVFVANGGSSEGSGGPNYVYFNSNSSGSYALGSPVQVGSSSNDSTAVALGKLGGTSSLSMYAFVVNDGAAATVWKFSNGSASFSQVTESSTFDSATNTAGTAVALGDLNGDGIPDAVVASGGSNGTITVWIGKGDGTFTQVQQSSIPSGDYVAVAIGRLR